MFALVALVFVDSLTLRAPWLGRLGTGEHHWLTGSTLLFARNWYHEGAWKLCWLMLETPKSPEFPTPADRIPYASYPPGTVVPVYLLGLAAGSEPGPTLVMGWNLFGHFLTACLVSLLVYGVLRGQGTAPWPAAAAGTAAGAIAVYNPAAMYFQQTVYFSDQAVVAPFVAFVVLEVLGRRVEGRAGRALRRLQYAVLLCGVATDWLFVPVMAVTLLKRRATGELGATSRERWQNALLFCAGPGLVAAAFLAQLHSVGAIGALVDKGFRRAGVGTAGVDQLRQVGGFDRRFWGEFFARGFGRVGAPLVWAGSAVWVLALLAAVARARRRAVSPRVRLLLEATGMLLGPCLLQVYLFRNHSAVHSFSVLKFSPVLAAVPFFFAPLLAQASLEEEWPARRLPPALRSALGGACLALALLYAWRLHADALSLFARDDTPYCQIAAAIRPVARESDVAFSPDLAITFEAGYPQLRALSMKCVYPATSPREIRKKVGGIQGDYDVLLVFLSPPGAEWSGLLKGVAPLATPPGPFPLRFYRVTPSRLRLARGTNHRGTEDTEKTKSEKGKRELVRREARRSRPEGPSPFFLFVFSVVLPSVSSVPLWFVP